MKASAVSTITKSLPIALSVLVNYSLLATLGYINLFLQKYLIRVQTMGVLRPDFQVKALKYGK